MNRLILTVCILSLSSLIGAAEQDARTLRVLETFEESVAKAKTKHDRIVDEAAEELMEVTRRAQQRAIRDLKRLVTARTDAATTASIYREVLSLDSADTEARQFFQAIGTLEQVLEGLDQRVETDLMGNPVAVSTDQAAMKKVLSLATKQELDKVFVFTGQYRYDAQNLRLHSGGGLETHKGFPDSFIVRIHAGTLAEWKPFDLALIRIRGVTVYQDRWPQRYQRNNDSPLKYLDVAFNAQRKEVLIATDQGVELARLSIEDVNRDAPALFIGDTGSAAFGSNISRIDIFAR